MSEKFYGAKAEAQKRINSLLRLAATGLEQDWEVEFADASRIQQMLDLYQSEDLDIDSRCALALLIVASVDEADTADRPEFNTLSEIAKLLKTNELIRQRMKYFWIELGRANHVSLVQKLVDDEI